MKNTFLALCLLASMAACSDGGKEDSTANNSETTLDSAAVGEVDTATVDEEEEVDMPENANPRSPKMEAEGKIGAATLTIDYNSPRKRDRVVFGELVKYDKVWRTGADDASKLTTDADLIVGGKALPAGEYAIFTIPQENGPWTVIFNNEAKQWGAYDYNEKEDALRLEIEPAMAEESKEEMTFTIMEDKIQFAWDKTLLNIPVSAK